MSKSPWLRQTLILSVLLNIALVGTFFYFLIHDNPLHFSYKPKAEGEYEDLEIAETLLGRLHALPYDKLLALLGDTRKMQHGYMVRDFALGALASFHDFDIGRCLGRKIASRKWESSGDTFLLFPGVSDEDFEQLQHFARTQLWPFSAKGLLRLIADKGIEESNTHLVNFFCHTPQFVLLETLFARAKAPVLKKNILSLALECGFDQIDEFYQRQEKNADFSPSIRQEFLLEALNKGSKTAAELLLLTDKKFAIQDLDNEQLLKIIDLISIDSPQGSQFLEMVAATPRSEVLREKALKKLSRYVNKGKEEVAGHFVEKPGLKNLRPTFRQEPPKAPDPRFHIVQPGESLWIIGRKYGVPLEVLMEANHLQSTVIQVGKSLKIPVLQ